MTLAADVDVAKARSAPRSPGAKAAVAYLTASGATAISITEHDGVCAFHVGHKIDPHAVSVQWLSETYSIAVTRRARKPAGDGPDTRTAEAALAQAAADQRATLTPNDVAMSRAAEAYRKIEQYMQSLYGTGVLKEFNRAFKRRRLAAMARGEGFMSYANATARLRLALIPLLVGGRTIAPVQSLFAQIFE